ncbi:P-loop containing nucleoside triphosphate hydrolase protein [Pestalotiopsis sp. NC0098]|nr:P-loop containing nucleoside triphosphate hydrolase protein [Pestalotiopsis sp. NC0098]
MDTRSDIYPREMQEADTVIAVMGITGSGKSTFISKIVGEDVVPIGHTLKSETKLTSAYKFRHKTHGEVHLIDTPGFDDTFTSDADILREIAYFMSRAYQKNVKLAGIIYLHRISDNRVGGSALRNLRIFKCLCGEDAFKHVMLATSMWDTIKESIAVQRETELVGEVGFWKDMRERGSLLARWSGSTESAQQIIEDVLSARSKNGPATLQIQKELVDDNKALDETLAGKELYKDLEELQLKFEERLSDVLQQTQEAILQKDGEWREELHQERIKLEEQRRQAEESQRALQVDLKKLLAETEDRYRVQQERWVEEMKTTNENIARSDSMLRQLQVENRAKEEELQAQLAKGARTEQEREELKANLKRIQEAKKKEDQLRQELEKKKQRKSTLKKVLLAIPKIVIPLGTLALAIFGVPPMF